MAIKNPFTSMRQSHERNLERQKGALSRATTEGSKQYAKSRIQSEKEMLLSIKQKESNWNKSHK